jgi:hypothetical protein
MHIVMAVILYPLSKRLYNGFFERNRISRLIANQAHVQDGQNSNGDPASTFFQVIKAASIVRLGLMEGLAMYGLVICMVAAQLGVLKIYPIFWLNTLSSVVLVGYIVHSFPTKERLEGIFREKRSDFLINRDL